MRNFIIQSAKTIDKEYIIPAQAYGYTAIEAIEYNNWLRNEKFYNYILNDDITFGKDKKINFLNTNCIPIGDVKYVLAWLNLMGVENVKPLNIPEELWKYCYRKIKIDCYKNTNERWFLKDVDDIKCPNNGKAWLNSNINSNKKYFLTEWIDDVISEWRIFVLDKEILGLHCYSGDEWILPSKSYVKTIVNDYNKRCYTLDIMITKAYSNEIVELHDFFSCGLYGFSDFTHLLNMWYLSINNILKGGENIEQLN